MWLVPPGAQADVHGCRQVNTITLNSQREPDVAATPQGEFIVVWSSTTSYPAIYGRRFSAEGLPIDTSEFRLNAHTTGTRLDPDVAYSGDGGFVVTWQATGVPGDDSSWSVWARRFDSEAVPLDAEEFLVNTITQGWQLDPKIDVLDDGSFVVVWEDFSADVRARRFGADGQPLDLVEFTVESTGSSPNRPVVKSLPENGFIVVWDMSSAPGDSFVTVQGRRFESDGTPIDTDQFQVNTYTEDWQQNADVAVNSSGDFTIAWASDGSLGSDDSGWSIQRRRYAADGSPIDPQEVQVNQIDLGTQREPAIASFGAGFVTAWEGFASADDDDDPQSIQAGRFDADGSPLDTTDVQVNCFTVGSQVRPVVAELPEGRAVVVWESPQADDDLDDSSVHMRLLQPSKIFVDGFESGDTSAWSTTVP